MKPLYLPANTSLIHGELLLTWLCNYCQQLFTRADIQQTNYLLLVANQAYLIPTPSLIISFRLEAIVHQHCPLPKGFTRQFKCLNKS